MSPVQVAHLVDTDNPSQLEEDLRTVVAKHRNNDGHINSQKQLANPSINGIASEGKNAINIIHNIRVMFQAYKY